MSSDVSEHGDYATALAAFQYDLPKVGKHNTADVKSDKARYSYKYADLAEISAVVLPALARHGLSWSTLPTIQDDGKFVLRYSLRHTSGQHESGTWPLPPTSSPPQTLGSAITYARRYCLCAVTGVSPDEDDDDGVAAQQGRLTERFDEPLWDIEIPQLVKDKNRAGLLKLHGQAKRLRPDDAALHARIVAAGQAVVASSREQEPAPQPGDAESSTEDAPLDSFDRAKETRRMFAQLAKGGIDPKDRDRRLAVVTRMLTRATPLESFNDLTDVEIASAVSFMERREADGDLAETLAQMVPVAQAVEGGVNGSLRKGAAKMSAQDIDMARNEIAEAQDVAALTEVWNRHAAYSIPPALKKAFETRGEELKRQVADTLWQQILERAPEDWTTGQIHDHFTSIAEVAPDEATAADMQRYLDTLAASTEAS